MSVFTRHASCESHGIIERALILAMKVDGIGVAVPGYVTRIRFSSRETPRRDSGSQVLSPRVSSPTRGYGRRASRRLSSTRSRRWHTDAAAAHTHLR
jgi:hypothetical protein